jgi:hypothetical protein
MATITLTANTNVSALTLASDDTIDLAGFVLTFDVQPTATGIQVTSPGTNGTCVFPVACVIPTWDFFAGATGSAGMIQTLPANCEIGSITGGPIANNRGIANNNGTVGVSNGGADSTAHGVATNNGTIGAANGGSGAFATGASTNNGTIHRANGGSFSTAHGVRFNNGLCLRLTDNVGRGVSDWNGGTCFVEGPFIDGVIPSNLKTIYSLGPLSENATIAGDATVITLSEGTGTAGFTGIRAISRRLGT